LGITISRLRFSGIAEEICGAFAVGTIQSRSPNISSTGTLMRLADGITDSNSGPRQADVIGNVPAGWKSAVADYRCDLGNFRGGDQ
jgi:hypothetical protein